MIRWFVLVLIAALSLSACGSVPQPFRGAPKLGTGNPLLDMPSATGVEVLPIEGIAPEVSARITRVIADQLMELEIPAEAVPKPGHLGFVLAGRASASVTSPGGEQFDITWSVRSRQGAVMARFNQTVQVPPETDVPVPVSRLAADYVADAMGLSKSPVIGPAAAAAAAVANRPTYPSISVKPVDGAPGDGRESLRLAILQALSDGGARRDDVNPDISLTCTFESKPLDLTQQHVTITWRALDRDGKELGVLHLENDIPSGALDGAWGPTAFAIAAAAQPNLLKLISIKPAN